MPKRVKDPVEVPEAELEVLSYLHRHGEADTAAIREGLDRFRSLTHASVSTLLHRLEERGLVRRRKAIRGKSFLYSATVTAEETYGGVMDRILERVFRNDRLAVVTSLFRGEPPTETETKQLRRLVADLHGKRKR